MPTPTPAETLRAAATRARELGDPRWSAVARLLDGYGTDWDMCPADHPGTALDEHALAVARVILGVEQCPECGTTGACNGGPCPLAAQPEATSGPCPGFEKEYQGVSDAKRRLANCKYCGRSRADHAAPPAPADRAAVLREAADVAEEEARALYDDMGQKAAASARMVGDRLRRLADETQQPVEDESCGRFVPDAPRAPGLCATCGDALGWHSREAVEAVGDEPFSLPGPPCIPDHSVPVRCPGCATPAEEPTL